MADTPIEGETASPVSVSNDASQTTAPAPQATDNGSTADVERLRKELEQQTMRSNQLANQLEEKTKAEQSGKQKRMEDQEELAKQVKALQDKLVERETQDAERERQATLKQGTDEILKDFPENVQKLAQTAGLSLSDDSEEAKKSLTEKLEEFKSTVGSPSVNATSNNARPTAPQTVDAETLVTRTAPGAESPMALAGARGDRSVIGQYINSLPEVQRMREIAKGA